MSSRRDRRADDNGVTILEVTIAAMLLIVALGAFSAGLARTQKTSNYATEREKSLDDLRLAAAEFTRDARQAAEVTTATTARVSFDQYLEVNAAHPGAEIVETTWEVINTAGGLQLKRTRNGGERVFLVKLTSDTVFEYEPNVFTAVGEIRRIRLFMSTKPLQKYPDVDLTVEVSLRNVG